MSRADPRPSSPPRPRAPARWRAALIAIALAVSTVSACKRARAPSEPAAGEADAQGTWEAWLELAPLLEVARTHAPEATVKALEDAAALLRDRKAKSAYKRLNELSGSEGRHWIAAARGDVASLYFVVCLRGVAWRLVDAEKDTPPSRTADFSEDAKVEPGDISVESLLTDLDAAVASQIPALATHGRISRARVAAYVSQCAPNDEVARMSQDVLKGDLATLAAEGALTPDLAYMWAGIQYADYSAAAAKPFLLRARETGYPDPAVSYMLAAIALEQLELELAERYAREALAAYKQLADASQQAQLWFVLGEIERARKRPAAARKHYRRAQELAPDHVAAILGEARLLLDDEGQGEGAAVALLTEHLSRLVELKAEVDARDDPAAALEGAAQNLEALVVMAAEPDIAAACRAALLETIEQDPEPLRRGLRYFYAATLDAKLGEYEHARGHAILARDEFAEGGGEGLLDQIDAFLEQIAAG